MTASPKVSRASAKKVENLQAKLFKLLNGSAADLEFLEAVTDIEPKDFELASRLMNRLDSRYLSGFLGILEQHSGCTSPAEEFIIHLVLIHTMEGLRPDMVEHSLEEFRENFDSMLKESGQFHRRYATYLQKVSKPKEKTR